MENHNQDQSAAHVRYTHRIYGKLRNSRDRFYPINGKGGFAGNLIYAAMFTEQNAIDACAALNRDNPDFIFEIRRFGSF